MGTIQLSSRISNSGGSEFTGRIDWNVVNETASYAEFEIVLLTYITAGYTYATIDGTIHANGTPVASGNWGTIYSSYIEAGQLAQVCSYRLRVNYDSAGTASAAISASATITNSGSFSGTISGSGTITAKRSAGASTISLYAQSVQMGKKLLISIDADSPECTHTLKYQFGGITAQIGTGIKNSCEWTVPDLADKCNNAVSGQCTITCTTYLDGSSLGSDTATVTLTVQDPTTPSVSSGEVTIGSPCSVGCSRNSANFTLKLEFEFKGTIFEIASGKIDSHSWTPEYEMARLIPTLTRGTGTLKCTTMNGSAEVGTRTVTIAAIVPENDITRPRFTADGLTLTPVNSLPEAFDGLYMRGKTGITAAFDAGSEYSTITEYALIIGNQSATGNPATIDLLVSEGDVKVTGRVTDARGFSTVVEATVSVMPYHNPRVIPYTGYSDVICERAMDTGELSPNGTYLMIKAGKMFSSVILDGVEMNSCDLRYRWKPSSVSAYSEWITLLDAGSPNQEITMLIGNVVSSLQQSYLVEIAAVDALGGRHNLTFQIMTQAISFVLYDGPDGAGFGKYPEEPHVVDIASHMTLLVRGNLRVLGYEWESIGLASGISESAYEMGRKETGCHYLVTEGQHVHIAFNCAFVYAGTSLIINETPIPAEIRPQRTVYTPCICNDRILACISAGTDGYIRVEWVQQATDTVMTGTADVTWVDGYLCYWT